MNERPCVHAINIDTRKSVVYYFCSEECRHDWVEEEGWRNLGLAELVDDYDVPPDVSQECEYCDLLVN